MKKTNIFGLVLILSTLLIGCAQPNTSEDIPEVYTITAAETTNGTISLSKTTAAAGETITVTATPASLWYELDAITVSDSTGTVNVNNNSFTMPAYNVTVTVTFKERVFENRDIPVAFYYNDIGNSIYVTAIGDDCTEITGSDYTWNNIFPTANKYSLIMNLIIYKDTDFDLYFTWNFDNQCTGLSIKSAELDNNLLKIVIH